MTSYTHSFSRSHIADDYLADVRHREQLEADADLFYRDVDLAIRKNTDDVEYAMMRDVHDDDEPVFYADLVDVGESAEANAGRLIRMHRENVGGVRL